MTEDFGQFGLNKEWDDPFLLYSSDSMPRDLVTALDWCRFLYFLNPQYRQAGSRVFRHFITDFDYPEDGDQKERDDWDDFLHDDIKLPDAMAEMGDEWACYGNSFFRLHFPFDRFLIDPRGGEHDLHKFPSDKTRFDLNTMTYLVPDPKDKNFPKSAKKIKMKFRDRVSKDRTRIRLIKLDPNYMVIEHSRISGRSRYIWRFDENIIADVKRGKLFAVSEMPQPMLLAIRDKQDFLFGDDQVFHFKAPVVSNVSINGWGIPGTLANYRSLFQLQVYRKIDEAIGLDYMVPFRLFSPSGDDKPGTNFETMNMSQWAGAVEEMIRRRRKDKFAMHAMPFPVHYEEFGGEGKELTPKDLIEYQTNSMLDGMGFPVELFKGSLQYMQVPTAMRMFENCWLFVHTGCSAFTKWTSRKCRSYLGLPKMEVKLQRPSLADSLERKQVILQLCSAGEISRETAYKAFGIDNPIEEVTKRMEEDVGIQKKKMKIDKDFQKEMASGATSDGGQDVQSTGGPSPSDINSRAQELAQYWLEIQSDGERSRAMQASKQNNPTLYALAKQMLEEARNQGASQGRASVNQQGQQGGGQGQSPGGAGGQGSAGAPPG